MQLFTPDEFALNYDGERLMYSEGVMAEATNYSPKQLEHGIRSIMDQVEADIDAPCTTSVRRGERGWVYVELEVKHIDEGKSLAPLVTVVGEILAYVRDRSEGAFEDTVRVAHALTSDGTTKPIEDDHFEEVD